MSKKFQISLLLIASILWLLFFSIGVVRSSEEFFIALRQNPLTFSLIFEALIPFIVIWTWTNVLILAICASLVGELGRSLSNQQSANLGAAFSRGFFIYLAFVTGQLVLGGELPLPGVGSEIITHGQYFRVSAFASLLAFVGGYSPEFFTSVLKRIESQATNREPPIK